MTDSLHNRSSNDLRVLITAHITALIVITLTVYSAVSNHQFVWDTIAFVLENPWVHEWSVANVISMLTESYRANWHPVVLLSHTLDISLFGYDSGKHHLMNVFFHLCNTVLLYLLIRRLLELHDLSITNHTSATWIAFLTALIFAIHPQHVESVAWVVERKDVLYTLLSLACFSTYLNAYQAEHPAAHWQKRAAPFIFFCLALGAKPMAVTLPVILVLLDVLLLKRYPLTVLGVLRSVTTKAHYFSLTILVIILTLNTQSMAMPSATALPAWVQALNALNNSLFYLEHYVWPVNLSPFYPYPKLEEIQSVGFWLPPLVALLAAIGASLYCLTKQITWPALLLGFYLVTLLPVSGLIHVGPAKATDHYVYLATVPFSFLTALGVIKLWKLREKLKAVVAACCVFYLAFLALISIQQVSYWNNPISLWGRVTTLYPNDPFPHRNLAAAYAQIEKWDLAVHHADLSISLGSPEQDYAQKLREHIASKEGVELP